MVKIENANKTELSNKKRQEVIENFIADKLANFEARDGSAPPVVENVGDKVRTTAWRWFVNHFFFIERGYVDKDSEYISLVRSRGTQEEQELAVANINFADKWRVLSCDTRTWGENLFADVDCSESAVVRSMLGFLFENKYITPDLKDSDEDEEEAAN